jgi:UDP-glucose 4-epimerase
MVQYNSFGSWGWLDDLPGDVMNEVEVHPGDVRDPRSVDTLVHGCETVYHLAALIAIPYSYQAPDSYVATNIGGTLNVLEAVRRHGTDRLVHTSTSEVYGTAREVPISESHPLHAQSPYAATKIAADKLVESYVLAYGLPAVTLRPFNTYGPRQSSRAVISTVLAQLSSGSQELRLGSLEPTRDFNFVTDTASAFIAVGRSPTEAVMGRTFNAGSGTETSIRDVVSLILKVTGSDAAIVEEPRRVRPETSEVMRLVADSSALTAATGWRPQVTLRDGLLRTAEWVRSAGRRPDASLDRFTL